MEKVLERLKKHRFAARFYLITVLAVPLVLLAPVYAAGKALFWGTPLLQFVPWWDLAWSTLQSGHLPLWNPYLGMGAPLLANYQSGLFYPPNWTYLLLHLVGGPPIMAWGMSVVVAFHLAWAGLGMAFLARRLGLSPLAQVTAGVAFGSCGYLVARGSFLSIISAAAWLPWVVFYATPRHWGLGLEKGQKVLLSACFALQLLAGHAQMTWYTWLFVGLWTAFLGWHGAYSSPESGLGSGNFSATVQLKTRALVRAGLQVALALALALGLAAIQLIPTFEYLTHSQRADAVDYDLAMTYSLWPWRLLGLFAPDLFGNPDRGDYWGYANYWEDALYTGVLPIFLAIAALLGAFKRRTNSTHPGEQAAEEIQAFVLGTAFRRFLLFVIGLSTLLALGKNTPVFPWLFRHVPTFDLFQAPTRLMIWAEFGICLAAGVGVQTWRRPQKRSLYWTRLGTAGALAISLGAGLTWIALGDIRPTFIRATTLMGILGIGCGLLSLTKPEMDDDEESGTEPKKNPRTRNIVWQTVVILFIIADLVIAGLGLNPGIDLQIYGLDAFSQNLNETLGAGRLYLPLADEQVLKYELYLRFDSFQIDQDWEGIRYTNLPNVNMLNGVRSANNFDPFLPERYAQWMTLLSDLDAAANAQLLELMDVEIVETIDHTHPQEVRFTPVLKGKRVRWVGCSLALPDGEAVLAAIRDTPVDYDSHVLLEGTSLPNQECLPVQPAGQVGIIDESPVHLAVQVSAPAAGFLVISDVWYPGWQAWVDGNPIPIQRANYLFRAIHLEKGEHEVRMHYRPVSVYSGGFASLLSLLVICLLIFRKRPAK